jgi:Zn-dependent protease
MTLDQIQDLVVTLVVMLLSIAVHEWAHAQVATSFGDPTPRENERLTLNPFAHFDPFGTLVWPAIGVLTGWGSIGWGRPTPWNASRFRRGVPIRRAELATALAGPVANALLALLCALLAGLLHALKGSAGDLATTLDALMQIALAGIHLNCILAIFHLMPVPPLDGLAVLRALLGDRHPLVETLEENALLTLGVVIVLSPWLVGIPAAILLRLVTSVL